MGQMLSHMSLPLGRGLQNSGLDGGWLRACRALVAGFFLALASVFWAPAQAQLQLTPLDFKRVNALSGNTVAWAVLRKSVAIGLNDAGLTKIASQSDSVDTIATILALEDPDNRLVSVLSGAARGGLMSASDATFAATMGLDGGRPKGIACLVYGQSPEERVLLADLVKLSQDERNNCSAHYSRIRDYWMNSIAAFLRRQEEAEGTLIDVELGPASGSLASARSVLIAGETIHEVAYFLRRTTRFSRPLLMRGTSCGAPDIKVDNASGQLVVCYELLTELVTHIGRSIEQSAQ